ncbi:hypothetical protein [Amycolatopsis sp. NPDC004169]|uniref:hypothetical protein n=1 Tax=Amycolatopsis sp. NPDC004169 TaxID=3154453 RepID=UPI0033B3EF98
MTLSGRWPPSRRPRCALRTANPGWAWDSAAVFPAALGGLVDAVFGTGQAELAG